MSEAASELNNSNLSHLWRHLGSVDKSENEGLRCRGTIPTPAKLRFSQDRESWEFLARSAVMHLLYRLVCPNPMRPSLAAH